MLIVISGISFYRKSLYRVSRPMYYQFESHRKFREFRLSSRMCLRPTLLGANKKCIRTYFSRDLREGLLLLAFLIRTQIIEITRALGTFGQYVFVETGSSR